MQNQANRTIRLFLFSEASAFTLAALIHFGALFGGYQHHKAGTAESVIAIVLWASLAWIGVLPNPARTIGLVAQGFALLGTLVGIFTIVVGIGPRTSPDLAYHVAIVIVLVSGLLMTGRSRDEHSTRRA